MNNWNVLAVLSVALIASANAQDHEPYGRDFWRSDAPAQAAVEAAKPRTPPSAAERRALEERLREMELDGGPYADGLSEPLFDLGRALEGAGDPEDALPVYQRALHILRVNDGLYSPRQAPLVRAILDLYRTSGDLPALDDRYDYFFRLYGSGQAPYDDVRLRAALEYLRWQQEAYRVGLPGDQVGRLVNAMELGERILEGVRVARNVDWSWQRDLVLTQLRTLYLLHYEVAPVLRMQEQLGQLRGSPIPALGTGQNSEFEDQRAINLARSLEGKGRSLLSISLPAARAAGADELARIHLELGDWLLWHDNRRSALAEYGKAEAQLREDKQAALLEQWLGEPAEIPGNGAFGPIEAEEVAVIGFTADYRVDARGRVRDLEITPLAGVEPARANGLSRRLRGTLFRPVIAGGEAQTSGLLTRQYQLED
ncbi:MAG: hypothetical protein AAGI11_04595 [Pseudomonadota bacterium]